MPEIRAKEFDLCRQWRGIIQVAASDHGWLPEIIAAIISRESRFGLLLDDEDKGDGGHGHGLMQIDDRSFGKWLRSHDWRDPAVNIGMGVQILTDKFNYLSDHTDLDGEALERAAVAAYNCGEGNVRKVVEAGADIDSRTAWHDYSRDVLARAEEFRAIFTE